MASLLLAAKEFCKKGLTTMQENRYGSAMPASVSVIAQFHGNKLFSHMTNPFF